MNNGNYETYVFVEIGTKRYETAKKNFSIKPNETDDEWRVRLGYDKGSWFVEPIYQRLDDKKSHPDRAELRLGRDLTDKLEVQTAFNNNDEAAAVGFYKWDSGEVGIGGNNSNDQLKANVAFIVRDVNNLPRFI